MTQNEITKIAKEVGFVDEEIDKCQLMFERFAHLVVQQEREACAKFIEHDYVRQFERPWREDLSAAIRARGQA
jgi:hypothetical protein